MDAGRGNAKLCNTVEASISKALKKLKLGQVQDPGRPLSVCTGEPLSQRTTKVPPQPCLPLHPHRSYKTGTTNMSANTWTESKNRAHILNGMFSNMKT